MVNNATVMAWKVQDSKTNALKESLLIVVALAAV